MNAAQRAKITLSLLLLFLAGVFEILVGFSDPSPWASGMALVVELGALVYLVTAGLDRRFLLALLFRAAGLAVTAAASLFPENLTAAALLTLAGLVCSLGTYCLTLLACADLMAGEGCPDEEKSCRRAVIVLPVCYALQAAVAVLELLLPEVTPTLALAGMVVTLGASILSVVFRLSCFWYCRKKLTESET